MVVDFPAPLGPRKPKTSPLRDREIETVDGDEIAEALDEVLDHDRVGTDSGMACFSAGDRIHEKVFNGGRNLLNRVEGDAGVLQPRFEFGNASGGIVDHNVHAIAGEHQA